MYKLIGVAVVALAIAAALLPLWLGGEGPEQAEVVEVEPKALDGPDGQGAGPDGQEGGPTSATAPPEGAANGEATPDQQEGAEEDRPWWKKPAGEGEAPEEAQAEGPAKEPSKGTDGPGQAAAPETPSPDPGPDSQEGKPAESGPAEEDTGEAAAADRPSEPAQEGDEAPADAGEGEEPRRVAKAEPPFWTVMVGSFQNPDNAAGLRDRLVDEGFPAQVRTREVEGQQWRRVLVGAEGSREAAQELVPRLEQAGYDNTLVLKVE